MRLFIAEKPELARAIAKGIDGSESKKDGYIQKGNEIISWAFGHILELKEPDEYNESYKKWKMNDLPLNVKFIYKPKATSRKQLKILQDLINRSDVNEIVHCGDADEEGQILIDEIITYSKTNKPVKRMLINDISEKAIRKELGNIKDNREFKSISECGFARSYADYIVGMNMTRAYTLANRNRGVLSVGRVQTPILALIYNREQENENFKSLEYYNLEAIFMEAKDIVFTLEFEEKITDKREIESLAFSLREKPFKLSIKKEDKTEAPPLAYNLLNLQSEASKLFGFSAKKTLDITQKLREEFGAITYNRSDCQYLPESVFDERYELLECLKHNFGNEFKYDLLDMETKSKVFDDSKLSAHYGIIPTQAKLDMSRLNQDQKAIYRLIAQRFLLQFATKREYESINLQAVNGDYTFSKTLNFTQKEGFRDFLGKKDDDNQDESDKSLREVIKNLENRLFDEVHIENMSITTHITKPPAKYSVTTLLKDLNQVSKYVKDERIKKLLREKDKDKKGESGGIGTPATRAEMIETLQKRDFIKVSSDKKQNISVTQKGKAFVESLSPMFKNLDMTALWFEMQKDIMEGKLTKNDFLNEVQKNINEEIKKIKEGAGKMASNEEVIKCPSCNNGELRRINGKNGFFWGCSAYQEGCRTTFPDLNGKPDFEAKSKKASGETTDFACPECKKGKLIRRESKNKQGVFWYGCSEFRNGCKYNCGEKDGKPDFEGKKN